MRDDLNTSKLEPALLDVSSGPDARPVVEPTFVTNAPGDIRGYKPLEENDEGTNNTKRIVGAAAVVVLIGALGAVTYFSGVLSPSATHSTQVASNQVPPPAIPTTAPPPQTVTPPAASDVTAPARAATATVAPPVRTARIRAARPHAQSVQPTDTDQIAPPPAIVPPPVTMTVPQIPSPTPDVTQTPPPAPQPVPDQPAQTPPPQ
jgi:hypothetical protein